MTFSRSYQNEQQKWKDTDSFSGTDLLKARRLAAKAYDAIADMRAADQTRLITHADKEQDPALPEKASIPA